MPLTPAKHLELSNYLLTLSYAAEHSTIKRPGHSLRGESYTFSARPYFSSALALEGKVGSSS